MGQSQRCLHASPRWDALVCPADSDNHAARCTAVRSSFKRPARERSQISTATVLIEKPIQNAIPKNWLGARCVSGLVAKKMPIIGRVVAIPRRMPIATDARVRVTLTDPVPLGPAGVSDTPYEAETRLVDVLKFKHLRVRVLDVYDLR